MAKKKDGYLLSEDWARMMKESYMHPGPFTKYFSPKRSWTSYTSGGGWTIGKVVQWREDGSVLVTSARKRK